ncbi:MAG: head-tail connector protein [Shimia sp.]
MMLIEETRLPDAVLPLAAFKDHLRMGTGFADDAAQDPVLAAFLRAALAAIEARTGKILVSREFSWQLSTWRDATGQALPVAPVSAIEEVVLVAPDGAETIVPPTAYRLERDHHRPKLVPLGGCLPAIPAGGQAEVVFEAGFGATFGDLPADLAHAVLMLAAHYYDNRSATGIADGALPYGVAVLIERYKTVRLLAGGRA